MSVIQMQSTTIQEAERLLKIMQKHGVHCSLEFKVEEGDADPIMSMVDVSVKVDYFEGVDEDRFLIVTLNDAEFSFSDKNCSFHKHFNGIQLDICISSDSFSAWLNSDSLKLGAIREI